MALPPHSPMAEEAVLGAMMLSSDACATVTRTLSAGDFYLPAHGLVFDAISALWGDGAVVEPVAIADRLAREGKIEAIGGSGTLIGIQSNAPVPSGASKYAEIVRDYSAMRRMMRVGEQISSIGAAQPTDLRAALAEAERLLDEVRMGFGRTGAVSASAAIDETVRHMEDLHEGRVPPALLTGLEPLDALIGGLPQGLNILGARPAMGKSVVGMQIAAHVAKTAPVLFVSKEMSRIEILMRLICAIADIDFGRARSGHMTDVEWEKLAVKHEDLLALPLFVLDEQDRDRPIEFADVVSEIRYLHRQQGLGLVVVDYLGLLATGASGRSNTEEEFARMSRGFKVLAGQLGVPILVLAQLNRGLEQRADKRPLLSDLRSSGSLEQDADLVVMLYREEVYGGSECERAGLIDLIVAKNRSGPTGSVEMRFRGDRMRLDRLQAGR